MALRDLLRVGFARSQAYDLLNLIIRDPDFFLLTTVQDFSSWRFIEFDRIVLPFIEINLRPAGTFSDLVPMDKVYKFISMKIGLNSCQLDFDKIIGKLSKFGLIHQSFEGCSFPIYHLVQLIERFDVNKEIEIMFYPIEEIHSERKNFDIFQDVYDHIQRVLATLKPQEEEVIALRYGIATERKETLEEIGFKFGLCRERIRQIQLTAIRKLQHPVRLNKIKVRYYEVLVANKGSRFLSYDIGKKYINMLSLLFELCGVPFYNRVNGLFIGATP